MIICYWIKVVRLKYDQMNQVIDLFIYVLNFEELDDLLNYIMEYFILKYCLFSLNFSFIFK